MDQPSHRALWLDPPSSSSAPNATAMRGRGSPRCTIATPLPGSATVLNFDKLTYAGSLSTVDEVAGS